MTTTQQTAQIILDQLRADGPLGTLACVGAREFMSSERDGCATLTFRITIRRNLKHYIEVTLDPSDTYTVRLVRTIRHRDGRFSRVIEREASNVYCDQLASTVYEFGHPY